jgi:hypothetical protein
MFANTYAAGGRVVRWWFHTNGTTTPGYDSNGLAKPISQQNIADLKSILDAAYAAGVSVTISLWSFDMLQQGQEGISSTTLTSNTNLLTVDANRQAYVDNVLTPLATALAGYHGLYAYEIFNEPEGMASDVKNAGWAGAKVPEASIQKTVNWFAAAIHAADASALVTNAAWTFQACANIAGSTNYYSDAALQAAGGKQSGTLDFYEVHYYTDNGASNSCFTNPASHWGLDKPIVMGEFYAVATDGVAANDLYTKAFDNGYHGAWAWEYTQSGGNMANTQWPAMQAPMQALYTAHASSLDCNNVSGGPMPPPPHLAVRAPSAAGEKDAAELTSLRVHDLAAQGRASEARALAEEAVNRHPDSAWVQEIEAFTGAHRHRNLRLTADGQLEYY